MRGRRLGGRCRAHWEDDRFGQAADPAGAGAEQQQLLAQFGRRGRVACGGPLARARPLRDNPSQPRARPEHRHTHCQSTRHLRHQQPPLPQVHTRAAEILTHEPGKQRPGDRATSDPVQPGARNLQLLALRRNGLSDSSSSERSPDSTKCRYSRLHGYRPVHMYAASTSILQTVFEKAVLHAARVRGNNVDDVDCRRCNFWNIGAAQGRILFQRYGSPCLRTFFCKGVPENTGVLLLLFPNDDGLDVLLRLGFSPEQTAPQEGSLRQHTRSRWRRTPRTASVARASAVDGRLANNGRYEPRFHRAGHAVDDPGSSGRLHRKQAPSLPRLPRNVARALKQLLESLSLLAAQQPFPQNLPRAVLYEAFVSTKADGIEATLLHYQHEWAGRLQHWWTGYLRSGAVLDGALLSGALFEPVTACGDDATSSLGDNSWRGADHVRSGCRHANGRAGRPNRGRDQLVQRGGGPIVGPITSPIILFILIVSVATTS